MPKDKKQLPGELRNGLVLYPNGTTWHYEVRWRGKKRKGDTKCESRPTAANWLKKEKERWAGQEHDEQAPPAITLREAFARWARLQKGQVDELHITNMRCAVETHAAAYLDTSISMIDNTAIMEIRSTYLNSDGRGYRKGQNWTSRRKHTEGGANSVVKLLSALLGWCRELGLIEAHPFKVKKLKPQPHPEGIVWPEKVQAFLAEADRGGRQHIAKDPEKAARQIRPLPHSSTAIRLMLGLGLREDEALGARWQWLDRRRMVYIVGEAKDRALREIPVPEWLMDYLEALREGKETGLILPSGKVHAETGESLPHHKNFSQKPVARIAAEMEISGLTPHRLRATFATTHYEAGTPLSQIAQMMGHEDPSTTMGYIVQRPKDQAQAQDRVAMLMGFKKAHHPHRVPRPPNDKA